MASQDGDIKVVRGLTPTFIVDGFNFCRPECNSYFLTHCHSDHTTGLHASFDLGMIYCTEVSAALLIGDRGLSQKMVSALPMNETVTIEDVEVTLVDANHCPGAAMIHFFDPATGNRVLHVGDFRASAWLVEGDALADLLKRGPIDHLYLDTTYNSPKHCFPPQDQVLDALARIVQTELEREPNTVFLVGSYSIGKEKAIEAVARAAASPALVSSRKARLVKMCQRDPDLYTEEDGPHVRVRVAGPGMSAGHEGLADLHLATRGKFASAVAFRPTGWMFTPSQKAQGYKPWCEGEVGSQTRVYAIPYSEHSSFNELQHFVKKVQPKCIIPTVNAENRDSEVNRFVQHMDLSQDLGRMDAYLVPPGMSKRAAGKRPAQIPLIDRVSVAEQARLWDEATAASPLTDAHSAERATCIETPTVDPSALSQLREMVCGPTEYLEALLRDGAGVVEHAIAIHFGANEGVVPVGAVAMETDGCAASLDGAAVCASKQLADAAVAAAEETDTDVFPRDMIVSVYGDDKSYRLFETREKVEARLHALGARVTRRKGKLTTHCIVPTGTKRSLVPKLDAAVALRDEGWLFRHVQRWKADGAVPRPVPKKQKSAAKKRRIEGAAAEEERGCKTRTATTDKLQRVARALSDRLYLVRWVDRTAEGGAAGWPRHQFTVLGSTGNVYSCEIAREPTCDCKDAAKGNTCKHLYFVYCRVLGLDQHESHIPFQRKLLRSELVTLFTSPPAVAATIMAAAEVQQKVDEAAVGSGGRRVDAPVAVVVTKRAPGGEPCAICFETMTAEVADSLQFCELGCGFPFHTACLIKWFAARGESGGAGSHNCPRCRTSWMPSAAARRDVDVGAAASAMPAEGYLNLATLQPGTSTARDTSQYSEWLEYHQRRRDREGGSVQPS